MEKIAWLVLGGTTFAAALLAAKRVRALRIGRWALGVLMICGGALVNAIYLATGTSFGNFADAAHFAFIRDTWHLVVAPHQILFIMLLIVFEAAAGALVLSGGTRAQIGFLGLIGMHIGLLGFGWVLTIWAAFMIPAFVLLLRAERRWAVQRSQGPSIRARPAELLSARASGLSA
jgi:hypothetical protein